MSSGSLAKYALLAGFAAAFIPAACGSSDESKSAPRDDGGNAGADDAAAGTPSAGKGASSVGGAGETSGGASAGNAPGGAALGAEASAGAPSAGAGGAGDAAGGACAIANDCPAGPVHLFNTGVDANGDPLVGGSVDPHYTLLKSADTTYAGPDAIVVSQIAAGYWVENSNASQWLAPSAIQVFPNPTPCDAAGAYTYRTTFVLSAEEAQTLKIEGAWAADNSGTDIVLNDVSLGITAASYAPLTSFTISTGFVTGTNTLDFSILDSGCPNGIRVELKASTQ